MSSVGLGRGTNNRRFSACIFSTIVAMAFLATLSDAAKATPVSTLDQSTVSRIQSVVPLNKKGTRIAFAATSFESLWDSIWVSDANGSNMRRLGEKHGKYDSPVYSIVASKDFKWLGYMRSSNFDPGFGVGLYGDQGFGLVNVESGKLRTVELHGPSVSSIIPDRSGFVVISGSVEPVYINARTGRKSKVRKTGSGSHFRGSNEPWVASDDLSEAGLCDTTNNRSERLRLGIIKPNGGRALIRKVPFSWTFSGGCQVSDDGSTVATVSAKARHKTLVALHHGRLIKVKLNSGLKHVVGISPSGRFALVQSQDPNYGQSGKIQRAAIVDLYHHKVRLLRGVSQLLGGENTVFHASMAWSQDERSVVVVSGKSSGQRLLGKLVLARDSGQVTILRQPKAPKGKRFDGVPVPVSLTDDGKSVGVTVTPRNGRLTDAYPYSVPLDGKSRARFLFSDSIKSYGGFSRSADGTHAWITGGNTCSESYRFPLMSIVDADPWAEPWVAEKTPSPSR